MNNSLDLSRLRLELERLFPSVMNKLPDLCHPPAPLLAGEEDYFNKTKHLELVPFKKQEVFERCVTPTLDEQRHEAVNSPTSDFIDVERSTSSCSLPSRNRQGSRSATKGHPGASELSLKQAKVSFLDDRAPTNHRRHGADRAKMDASGTTSRRLRRGITADETREKLELRNRLNAHYSRMKLKPRLASEETKRRQLECLNRISIGATGQRAGSACPFADPMPECMLTRENMGNLREIIVSATDIEWRMLTPVRPASEYEELYFDKLIQLHRNHYKYQVSETKLSAREAQGPATGSPSATRRGSPAAMISADNRSKFRHTRHRSSVSPNPMRRQRIVAASEQQQLLKSQVSMSLGMRLKGKFHARSSFALGGPMANGLNVPRLILTADGEVDPHDERDDDETSVAAIRERDSMKDAKQPLAAAAGLQAQTQNEKANQHRGGGGRLRIAGAHVALQTRCAFGKRREAADRDAQQC